VLCRVPLILAKELPQLGFHYFPLNGSMPSDVTNLICQRRKLRLGEADGFAQTFLSVFGRVTKP
jgi:hypothetical protein